MNQQHDGFVYVQTNDAELNEVVVYRRGGDGRLDRLGSYLTGGKGSGKPHLPSQASVVLADGRLFVTNAGSDDLTVFAVTGDVLQRLDRVPSGGSTPTSVAVHGSWVYVLNSRGAADVSGFSLGDGGRIAALVGSSRELGEGSDPAQVAFSPEGRTLVVTDRAANSIHAFAVGEDGLLAEHAAHPSAGMTPYGFDFAPDGTLVVTEAAGAQVGKASASSYRLDGERELVPVSAAVPNTRSEVCWAVVGAGGRIAFVTNFGDGTISTYELGPGGAIRLRDAVAATTVEGGPGIRDEAISSDGRFLYALHADARKVFAWEVGEDGTLVALGSANGLPATAAGLAAS
jgi:6-phosphogluconolactonase (cycloisomerase 2 family)